MTIFTHSLYICCHLPTGIICYLHVLEDNSLISKRYSLISKRLHSQMERILGGGAGEERGCMSPQPALPPCDMYLESQSTAQSQDSVPRKHPRQSHLISMSFPASPHHQGSSLPQLPNWKGFYRLKVPTTQRKIPS